LRWVLGARGVIWHQNGPKEPFGGYLYIIDKFFASILDIVYTYNLYVPKLNNLHVNMLLILAVFIFD